MTNGRVEFLKMKIDTLSKEEIISKIESFCMSGGYHYQISVNVAKTVYAQKDERLVEIINSADLINADGMPIYVALKLLSKKPVVRMGGLDYMEELAIRHPEYRYYFWGAKEEVLFKTVEYYKQKYGMNIVGSRNGYYKQNEFEDIINTINDLEVDVLFIGMGTPKKENMLYNCREILNVNYAVGVGGAFDIVAGKTKRAPIIMQKMSLEWLYRLLQEPGRMWKRYLFTNCLFFYYIIFNLPKIVIERNRFKKISAN